MRNQTSRKKIAGSFIVLVIVLGSVTFGPKLKDYVTMRLILREGITFYNHKKYIPALGKFMNVLRINPHNEEARRYLRSTIDQVRQAGYAPTSSGATEQ